MEFQLTGYMMGQLEKKLAPLQKRAGKLGLPPLAVKILKTTMVKVRSADGEVKLYKEHLVWLSGAEPKVGEYEFVATLDHRETGVILRKSPSFTEDLPARFRATDKTCDHCQKMRHRAEVFVLRGAGGTFVQVGRQCLKDFLGGVDPAAYAKMLEEWAQFEAWLEDGGDGEESGRYGGGADYYASAEEVLQKSAQSIRMYGWVARSAKAGFATADRVAGALFGKDKLATTGYQELPAYYDEKFTDGAHVRATVSGLGNLEPTEADKALAAGTLAHIAGLPGKSDFEQNLKVLCHPGLEYVQQKDVGMVAAAVMVYERYLGNEAKYKVEREQKAKLVTDSSYVGQIGKRMTGELTLVDKKSFEGPYGVRTLVSLVDADGNALSWWTGYVGKGELADVERGSKLGPCAFTPKKHEEYRGVKQTTVTRVASKIRVYA